MEREDHSPDEQKKQDKRVHRKEIWSRGFLLYQLNSKSNHCLRVEIKKKSLKKFFVLFSLLTYLTVKNLCEIYSVVYITNYQPLTRASIC